MHFTSGNSLAADWPVQIILAVILCIFIGLFEETAFRVLINDAILYKFRNSKHVFVWIAVISSFVFGAVHVLPADYSSVSAVVTAILKIVQVGLFGFCLLIMYWKTRNIWGIALAHALFDGLSVVPEAMFNDTSDIGSADLYVNSGSNGMIGLAGFIAVLTVAAVILWINIGRKIDFDEIRKTW